MKPYPFVIALCLLTACSQGASTAQSGANANAASTAAAPTSDTASGGMPGSPCDVIAAADVAGIIIAPVTRASADSAPDLCIYEAKSHAKVTISEGQGDTAKGAWMLATTYNGAKTPLAGVGDEALYGPEGATLIARKGNRSCRVDVLGYDNSDAMDEITKDRDDALAKKLGALCNKLFASQ